jgi:hypothetical protein
MNGTEDMFYLLTARQYLPDNMLESLLVSKRGTLGVVGFQKLAQGYSDTITERDSAKTEIAKVRDAVRDKYRKDNALKKDAPVSEDEVNKYLEKWRNWEAVQPPEAVLTGIYRVAEAAFRKKYPANESTPEAVARFVAAEAFP